jgi:hypothetical protein
MFRETRELFCRSSRAERPAYGRETISRSPMRARTDGSHRQRPRPPSRISHTFSQPLQPDSSFNCRSGVEGAREDMEDVFQFVWQSVEFLAGIHTVITLVSFLAHFFQPVDLVLLKIPISAIPILEPPRPAPPAAANPVIVHVHTHVYVNSDSDRQKRKEIPALKSAKKPKRCEQKRSCNPKKRRNADFRRYGKADSRKPQGQNED